MQVHWVRTPYGRGSTATAAGQ